VAAGFASGAVLAVLLGATVGLSRHAEAMLDPTFQALRAIPSLAWVPPAAVARHRRSAKDRTDRNRRLLPRLHGCRLRHPRRGPQTDRSRTPVPPVQHALTRRVLLPAALPAILTGLRNGLSLAWMFMVAAELIAASKGLGYLLSDGRETSRADIVLAASCAAGHPRQNQRHTDGRNRTTQPRMARQLRMTIALDIHVKEKALRHAHRAARRQPATTRGRSGKPDRRQRLRQKQPAVDRLGTGPRFQRRDKTERQPLHGTSGDIGFIFQEPRLFPWLTVAETSPSAATTNNW
jgi:hypothetical protein